jgi:outer membrane lipoprotein carrier protein
MRAISKFTGVVFLLAVTLLPYASGAGDTPPGESLVEAFITDVTTLSARFEQSVIDAEGELLDQSNGSIAIARPGRFRWATDEPYEQQIIADGLNVWSYDVDLAQVTVKAQAEALASTPAMLLGGGREALDEFLIEETVPDGNVTWVRMVPRDDSSGFKRLVLGFEEEKLRRMVFLDNLEQQTVVELSDVVYNEAFDGASFEFTPPDDVDIVGTPAAAGTP